MLHLGFALCTTVHNVLIQMSSYVSVVYLTCLDILIPAIVAEFYRI